MEARLPLLILLGLTAYAEDPSPERQCADAAAGREAEVCLQLAADHPEDVDAIAAALRAHIDRGSAPERDLLQALLLLLSDETGAAGARELGQINDPRAIDPLVHTALHRELPVALAAVEALGHYKQGLEPLSRFLLDSHLPIEVRKASADALGQMGGVDAGDVLIGALRRRGVPLALRESMLATVAAHFPDRMADLGGQVSEDGSLWLAGGGGFGLGYALFETGRFGQANLGALGAGSGALAGASVGFLAGRAWPMEAGDAAFIAGNGIAGTLGGHLIGLGVAPRHADRGSLVGGLLGEGAGYSLGVGLRGAQHGEEVDAVEALAFAGTLALTATAFTSDRRGVTGDEGIPQLAGGIGLIVGEGIGEVIAPKIRLSKADAAMISLSTAYGFAAGQLAPKGRARTRWPLQLAGAGTGALVSYALAGPVELKPDVVAGSALGVGFGGSLGWGVGLLFDPDDSTDVPEATTLAGATAGLGVGGLLAWKNQRPPEWSDSVAIGVAVSWAGVQTAGWESVSAGNLDDKRPLLLIPAGVGAIAAIATPRLDIPATSSLAATSLGVWGGYVAGVGAQLTHQPFLPYALVGSDVGLGVGAVAMSPRVNTPPLVIGLADAGGVIGGSLSALGASFATEDKNAILGTSLLGAGVGFAGGAVFGGTLVGKTRDIAFVVPHVHVHVPGAWALTPTVLPVPGTTDAAYGAMLTGSGW